jgi:hypothetical protein
MNRPIWIAASLCAIAFLAACAGSNAVNPSVQPQSNAGSLLAVPTAASNPPAIYSINFSSGRLEFWPLSPSGGTQPTVLSTFGARDGMAADGSVLLFGALHHQSLVLFDTISQTEKQFADPFGPPGDIAVDKHHNIYAVSYATPDSKVADFPANDRNHPFELSCSLLHIGGVIAANNEGDVFVVGAGPPPGNATISLEYERSATGHAACRNMHLVAPSDNASGLAVDPKTDDLLIMDNPGECAGGLEGRVRIFPKPYQQGNFRVLQMGANCSGGLRLNADSTVIFAGDEDVSGSFSFILQRTYPGGRALGTYFGGDTTGFATIPNSLPN